MSKHHLQNLAEQLAAKGRATSPFHYGKSSYQTSNSVKSGDIKTKVEIDIDSIQLLAYQIHQDKGGSALDNWLEAEQKLE